MWQGHYRQSEPAHRDYVLWRDPCRRRDLLHTSVPGAPEPQHFRPGLPWYTTVGPGQNQFVPHALPHTFHRDSAQPCFPLFPQPACTIPQHVWDCSRRECPRHRALPISKAPAHSYCLPLFSAIPQPVFRPWAYRGQSHTYCQGYTATPYHRDCQPQQTIRRHESDPAQHHHLCCTYAPSVSGLPYCPKERLC